MGRLNAEHEFGVALFETTWVIFQVKQHTLHTIESLDHVFPPVIYLWHWTLHWTKLIVRATSQDKIVLNSTISSLNARILDIFMRALRQKQRRQAGLRTSHIKFCHISLSNKRKSSRTNMFREFLRQAYHGNLCWLCSVR